MLRKIFFFAYFLIGSYSLFAQQRSENVEVIGQVENPLRLSIADLQKMNVRTGENLKIVSQNGEVRKEFKTYRGVLLKEVLEKAHIKLATMKDRNKILVAAHATDGYVALFAYHELFNNATGEQVWLLFEENNKPIEADGAIVLVCLDDHLTGPRHVKWLSRIEVRSI